MDEETAESSKQPASLKIILEPMIGNGVISEVDSIKCVVLSKVKKHVPYGEVVGTTACVTLQPRYRTNRGRYKFNGIYCTNTTAGNLYLRTSPQSGGCWNKGSRNTLLKVRAQQISHQPNELSVIALSFTVFDQISLCVIANFRREVEENCALLGYYTAYSGNSII